MKTILVDDVLWNMMQFKKECEDIPEFEIVGEFSNAEDALLYAKDHPVEFALLDIEMPGMNGVTLARELRALYPKIIIIFLTGHKEYLEEFIKIKADYYIFKPYIREDILDAIQRVRLLSGRLKKRIEVRTFGKFEVLIDGKPAFSNMKKEKELFALLIDQAGTAVSNREIVQKLWPEQDAREKMNNGRVVTFRLREALEKDNLGYVLRSSQGGRYINPSDVDCDLFEFLAGNRELFHGEYMAEYSWGEERIGRLAAMRKE